MPLKCLMMGLSMKLLPLGVVPWPFSSSLFQPTWGRIVKQPILEQAESLSAGPPLAALADLFSIPLSSRSWAPGD
jgi:hypothetical protein